MAKSSCSNRIRQAVTELLQVGTSNGGDAARQMASSPAMKRQNGVAAQRPPCSKQVDRDHQLGRGNTKPPRRVLASKRNEGLTRADMIAAGLRSHPHRSRP